MAKQKTAPGRKSKRSDAGKKKKDPNAPKRGLSAYMFFANEQREIVREEEPNLTFGQVGKALGKKWKELSPDERAPYESKARADKERYESEKANYAAGGDDDDDEE